MIWLSRLFGLKWKVKYVREIRKSTNNQWLGSVIITRDNVDRVETFLFKDQPTMRQVKKKAQMVCDSRNGSGERDAFHIVDIHGNKLETLHGVWKDAVTFEVKNRN